MSQEASKMLLFRAFRDDDAGVWVAISDEHDIATEGDTQDHLVQRILVLVPGVFDARGQSTETPASIRIEWQAMQTYGTTDFKLAKVA